MSYYKESVDFNIEGHLKIKSLRTGRIILAKKNLIVNSAKTIMASTLAGSPSGDFINYIAFGDDTVAPVVSNTALGNQVHQITCGYQTQPVPFFEDQTETDGSTTITSTVIFSGIVDSDAEFSATEAGLFSQKEFLFSRVTFDEITKNIGEPWLVQWKLIIGL
jgi:hypothetical protein